MVKSWIRTANRIPRQAHKSIRNRLIDDPANRYRMQAKKLCEAILINVSKIVNRL